MQNIIFSCEVITPMFLYGADNNTPEFRIASFKGALRFWWRALHPELEIETMKEYEGKIFGNTDNKSNVLIKETGTKLIYDDESKMPMLPHKKDNKKESLITNCFPVGAIFEISLSLMKEVKIKETSNFNLEQLENLFITLAILGGLGKRTRRGFGSFKITKINNDEFKMPNTLEEIINFLPKNKFKIENNNIIKRIETYNRNYPYIKNIQLGKVPNEDINKAIINASHKVKEEEYKRAGNVAIKNNDYTYEKGKRKLNSQKYSDFEAAIGDGKKKYASPIYVSVLENQPIITTLHHDAPSEIKSRHTALQNEFINYLIN